MRTLRRFILFGISGVPRSVPRRQGSAVAGSPYASCPRCPLTPTLITPREARGLSEDERNLFRVGREILLTSNARRKAEATVAFVSATRKLPLSDTEIRAWAVSTFTATHRVLNIFRLMFCLLRTSLRAQSALFLFHQENVRVRKSSAYRHLFGCFTRSLVRCIGFSFQ